MTRSGITPFLEKKKHGRDFHPYYGVYVRLETIAGTLVEGVGCLRVRERQRDHCRSTPILCHVMRLS